MRCRSQQNLSLNKKKKETNEQLLKIEGSNKKNIKENVVENTETDENKVSNFKKLDQGDGQELIILTIKLKDKIIQATIRETTSISHVCELISLFGDFKSYPKKFKEIFHNYLKTEYNNVLTNNKLIIIPTTQSITTGFSVGGTTNEFPPSTTDLSQNINNFTEPSAMNFPHPMMENLNTDQAISHGFMEP